MKSFFLIVLLGFSGGLYADAVDGLDKEFSQVEEHYKNVKTDDTIKKKILEKNILSAVRMTVIKRFPDYNLLLKDLKMSDISYQYKSETKICYVKYKTYLYSYTYYKDPQVYLQSPINEIYYLKPEKMEHQTEAAPKTN